MIGFIRLSDIPKFLVSFVVGIVFIGVFLTILANFPSLLKRLPEGFFAVVMVLIVMASYKTGEYIWETFENYADTRRSRKIVKKNKIKKSN